MDRAGAVFLTMSLRWSMIVQTAPFGRVLWRIRQRDVSLREIFPVQRIALEGSVKTDRVNAMRNDASPWGSRRLSIRHFAEESRHTCALNSKIIFVYVYLRKLRKIAPISRGRHNRKLLLSPNRFRDARAMRSCVCRACVRACVFYVMIVLYLLLMLNLYIHC